MMSHPIDGLRQVLNPVAAGCFLNLLAFYFALFLQLTLSQQHRGYTNLSIDNSCVEVELGCDNLVHFSISPFNCLSSFAGQFPNVLHKQCSLPACLHRNAQNSNKMLRLLSATRTASQVITLAKSSGIALGFPHRFCLDISLRDFLMEFTEVARNPRKGV